jgi:hypothetical protein
MAAGCNCKAAIGCVDARAPVRASYVSLYKWPESDAEFVRSVAMARRQGGGGGQESPGGGASAPSYSYHHYYYNGSGSMRSNNSGELAAAGYCSPRVVDSYSCRQMYLRSYTFSKRKETVPERTMACLGRVRDRGAAVFPLFHPQRHGGGSAAAAAAAASDAASVGSASHRTEDDGVLGLRRGSKQQQRRRRRKKNKKKGCAVVRRLHEASCGAVRAIFRRLLACTTSVDVADGGAAAPRS